LLFSFFRLLEIIGGEVSGQTNLMLAMTMPMQEAAKIQ